MPLEESIGRRIRRLRKAKRRKTGVKCRRSDLANDAGLSIEDVKDWEEDVAQPNAQQAEAVGQVLGVSGDYVLGRVESQRVEWENFRGRAPVPDLGLHQHMGSTLWVLQTFEETVNMTIVALVTGAHGIGLSRGEALLDDARTLTLGSKRTLLSDALDLEQGFLDDLDELIKHRNWVVHGLHVDIKSGKTTRSQAIDRMLETVDRANNLSHRLLDEIDRISQAHGISREALEAAIEAELGRRSGAGGC